MANIAVDFPAMNRHEATLLRCIASLGVYEARLGIIRAGVDSAVSSRNAIGSRLKKAGGMIKDCATGAYSLRSACNKVEACYRRTERKLVDSASDAKGTADSLWGNILQGGLITGGAAWKADLGKLTVGAAATGSVLGYSVTTKLKSDFSLKDKKFGAEAKIKGKVYGAKGKISAKTGNLERSVEGALLTAAVTGAIGLTLYNDGKLSPSAFVKAKAGVAAVEGSADIKHGSDDNNFYGKAEGSALGAEAGAEGNVGVITDENGNRSFGVSGKVGAEAYVAKGEISGGFTLFGIKFGAALEGKVGAGVSAGGSVTTGGVSLGLSGALGVGGGVKLNIDWSNCTLF